MMITHLISGGQTGADQGALVAAASLGISTGGWVPKGWKTEEGPAAWLADFGCQEHGSAQYAPRTIANVRRADATIWFGDLSSPGGRLTIRTCELDELPLMLIAYPESRPRADKASGTVRIIRTWLREAPKIKRLNIAGNRESSNPGIGAFVDAVLREALKPS